MHLKSMHDDDGPGGTFVVGEEFEINTQVAGQVRTIILADNGAGPGASLPLKHLDRAWLGTVVTLSTRSRGKAHRPDECTAGDVLPP